MEDTYPDPAAAADKSVNTALFRGQPVDNLVHVDNYPVDNESVSDGLESASGESTAQPPQDVALNALSNARSGAARRPRRRGARHLDAGAGTEGTGRNVGGYSGAGTDPERDPHALGSLVDGFVADQGWQAQLAHARVFAGWDQLVGPDVAAHCTPVSLREGELRVSAQSTAWATQLRLLASALLVRLVAELGPELVTKIVITGPTGPSWKHGPRTVRGHRGPRDTYG